MTSLSRCLIPREVAERWRIDTEAVLELIRGGELKAFTLSPAGARRPRWKIDPAEVAAFEERRQARTPAMKPVRRKRQPADVIQFYT